MVRDYKGDYQREQAEHKNTKVKLSSTTKRVSEQNQELDSLRLQKKAGAFATENELKTRINVFEKQQRELFYRLTKHLPNGWENKSIRELFQAGHNEGLQNFMVEALNWVGDMAASNRPNPPTMLSQVPEVTNPVGQMTEPKMTGMLR